MSRILVFSEPQLIGAFEPDDPGSGYYNDLRGVALEHRSPEAALEALGLATRERRLANPVSVAQIGLGAWQLGLENTRWFPVVAATSDWLVAELDDEGRIPYLFALPHTYRLDPPWHSAMAQGEAASLLIRRRPPSSGRSSRTEHSPRFDRSWTSALGSWRRRARAPCSRNTRPNPPPMS